MTAPDKIYVREYPDGINQFWDRKKRDDVVATIYHEYIRKDALLEWIQEDIISLIESRIGEILGDAQPKPALRAELREMINKIKEK